ncbi:voltage-dependent calcium channel subunit alpha-2/delta-1 isoform X1 [Lates japonicus]|uniref:Voltage-dependent calcium channel subunit alpha-2/delta-1 isoform X1 n=1 Tax=Lates japonicus TaxID=270547 RepID=A0AAD3MV84_LATJO|nr:voltage-dependent calcium channel subunit alpha-2/delta-1 isoform X1 [Lates japonicus]
MDTCRVRAWVFLVLLCQDGSLASQFPTQLMIKEWVDQMQKELVTLADTATAGKKPYSDFSEKPTPLHCGAKRRRGAGGQSSQEH